MARDYGKVSPRFWTGETGRKLRKHPEAQTLALYLITAPGSTMTGIYYLAIPTAAHETGLTIQEVSAALAILAEIDFAHYDESNELVWVPSMAAWQIDDKLVASDKRVAGVKKEILFHQNHPFVVAFWELYGEAYEMGPCPFPSAMKGLTDPMIPPTKDLTKGLGMGLTKALASQEQDQDQEQEQEIPPPARDPAAPDASVQAVVQQAVQGALSEPAGKAGDVTAGLVPVDPVRDPLTWAGLQFLWGEARVRHLGGVPHVASAGIGDGLQEALDFVREHPEMAPHVARSMDRFWANVKAGAHDRSAEIVRKAAFAFGCWRQDFGPDYEEFIGKAPKIAAKPLGVQRCAWHAKGGKGASRKPLDACPECREDRARNGGRSGEPTTLAGVVATFKPLEQPKNPATAEQLEQLRIERRAGARASPAPADDQPPAPKSSAAGGTA